MGKKKKEIGELLELLNEYQNKYVPDYPIRASEETINSGREILISKRYGFIKWLVENDKIEHEMPIETLSFREYYDIKKSDFLIMLLSISDTPIEDLILYLK